MWFKSSYNKSKNKKETDSKGMFKDLKNSKDKDSKKDVNQSIFYMYSIIGLQVLFIFFLLATFLVIRTIINTPYWVFLIILAFGVIGCIYTYYKIKRQFHKVKEAFQSMDLSNKNFEVSIMGGAISMRVENNPSRLLEAPREQPALEAAPVENPQNKEIKKQPNVEKKPTEETDTICI